MITLYSNNCPMCMMLKEKLNSLGLNYQIVYNVDIMKEKGIKNVPMLEIDGELLDVKQALRRLKSMEAQ